jgi:hypothetical protein
MNGIKKFIATIVCFSFLATFAPVSALAITEGQVSVLSTFIKIFKLDTIVVFKIGKAITDYQAIKTNPIKPSSGSYSLPSGGSSISVPPVNPSLANKPSSSGSVSTNLPLKLPTTPPAIGDAMPSSFYQYTNASPKPWCHTFTIDLLIGSSGTEVLFLQRALNVFGYTQVENGEFDRQTQGNVYLLQKKLSMAGGTRTPGYVGVDLRGELNRIFKCINTAEKVCFPGYYYYVTWSESCKYVDKQICNPTSYNIYMTAQECATAGKNGWFYSY